MVWFREPGAGYLPECFPPVDGCHLSFVSGVWQERRMTGGAVRHHCVLFERESSGGSLNPRKLFQ
ncbi:hypothetical protein HMPREF3038_01031 [Akkermansia sp. KLE1797]|nr:hypothetical protein HMPREF3038_01031 [Akkermansia sp. KLE1797]KXU53394.1 hypothetical protein HMPREF3039_02395 [Akkermansia sp. KLE1798]KZA05067.1 hypothetical protein HMPREF1326_01286 [Akkermansia sp. KLE1605]